jgi:hypothetical protein
VRMKRIGVFVFSAVAALTTAIALSGAGRPLPAAGPALHTPPGGGVGDPDIVELAIEHSPVRVRLWDAPGPDGAVAPHYAISLDGRTFSPPRATSYVIKLRHGDFDPLSSQLVPDVHPRLTAGDDTNMHIVQFVTQPLQVYRDAVENLGGTVSFFLANHAHVVTMDAETRDAVAELPFVRWIGPYHPAYRLETFLRENINDAAQAYPELRYNIMITESAMDAKISVADRIEQLGGKVDRAHAGKYLLEATLTSEQLFDVARLDDVLFIDRWSEYEKDMDISRDISGSDYVELTAGYTGQGVRGEAFDGGFNLGHIDFASRPLIVHGTAGSDAHGAATSGVCFGDGAGDAAARGHLPDGQGIVSNYSGVMETSTRYDHTGELLEAPYFGVFQTSSVGSTRTTEYSTISADNDAALFDFDVVHCQSQSNAGTRDSRPQAWAKNIISGGAVNHYNTADKADDCWCSGASIGPATDGRIKPDLCHFYDDTYTTYVSSGDGYGEFGGTSGATPNICGLTGLFFEMWADDDGTGYGAVFGNQLAVPGGTVFENRCHMTTAKAVMINTAEQYAFSGTGHDLTRVHQGWGMPNVQRAYDMGVAQKMVIIDETEVIGQLETATFAVGVAPGELELKVTMTWADPPGLPASSQDRINDLTLRVTSPSGVTYYGNNGLLEGNYSTPDGDPNTIDTVECVFVANPEAGSWTVDVIAQEINTDGHVETPGVVDADFALVVSGAASGPSFTLSATPSQQQVCAPDDAVYTIDVGQIMGFADPVTMAAEDLPAGATAVFDPNPVMPGASTVLTISNTGAVTPGDYAVKAAGQSGDTSRARIVMLQLSDAAPGAVTLLTPAVGAADVALEPTFTWNAVTQASEYHLVVATNASLTNPVIDEYTTEPTFGSPLRLDSITTYYWRVTAINGCGDSVSAVGDFTTLEQPDYFTEEMTPFDLDGLASTFTPDGSGDYYLVCTETITELPTDPAGGTSISLSDDDYETIAAPHTVHLYGVGYNSFHIGSNGYITFTGGDSDYSETLADHFDTPRVSALFDDFNPSSAGTVSWKSLADRVAVTWENVPEYNTSTSNTFQAELFFDGAIRLSWLGIAATDGIVGLSDGGGVPIDYLASDISDADCSDCPWDLSVPADGVVGLGDLNAMLSNWGPCPAPPAECPWDLSTPADGTVGLGDLNALLSNWGPCP